MQDAVRILIVDDSATYRHVLTRVVAEIPKTELVGTAANGRIALRKVDELTPDLVLLDVTMPDIDGVETLRQIKKKYPAIQAIMISGIDKANAKATLQSLEVGAMDFISKPTSNDLSASIEKLVTELKPLIGIVEIKKNSSVRTERSQSLPTHGTTATVAPSPKTTVVPTARNTISDSSQNIEWIFIGVSTGGPNALQELIPSIQITKNTPPILIVQHMPPMFTESLAERLQKISGKPVSEAKDGEVPQRGKAYIVPGGYHMVFQRNIKGVYLQLNDGPRVHNCKPSVDVLFNSAVNFVNQSSVLSIIMTGMGRDGTEGVRNLKKKNATCIIQDESSSVVWGMPGSVYEAGLADEILPLENLGERIQQIVRK